MIRGLIASSGIHLFLLMGLLISGLVAPSKNAIRPELALGHLTFMPAKPNSMSSGGTQTQADPSARSPAMQDSEAISTASAPAAEPKPAAKKPPRPSGKARIVRESDVLDKPDPASDSPNATSREERPPESRASMTPLIDVDSLPRDAAPAASKKENADGSSWGTVSGHAAGHDGAGELGPGYTRNALFKIQQNFHAPYEMPGVTCVVQFKVMKDGKVTELKISRGSGRPDLDQSALKAIELTGSLQPLYDDYSKPFTTAEVTFEFVKQD